MHPEDSKALKLMLGAFARTLKIRLTPRVAEFAGSLSREAYLLGKKRACAEMTESVDDLRVKHGSDP